MRLILHTHFAGLLQVQCQSEKEVLLMCDCKDLPATLDRLNNVVSGWYDALQTAPTEHYEYSGPMFVGGVAAVYTARSPYIGDCQFSVASAVAGATAAQILVSPFRMTTGIDMTGAVQSYAENSALPALVFMVPASTTINGPRTWYNVMNSENSVYVVVVAASNLAGVNIQFRQKR